MLADRSSSVGATSCPPSPSAARIRRRQMLRGGGGKCANSALQSPLAFANGDGPLYFRGHLATESGPDRGPEGPDGAGGAVVFPPYFGRRSSALFQSLLELSARQDVV